LSFAETILAIWCILVVIFFRTKFSYLQNNKLLQIRGNL